MEMLKWCGFPHSRLDYQVSLPNGRDRLQIVAAREAGTLSSYDAAGPGAAPPWASMNASTVKRPMAKLRR
jgi:hypothetical protein